MYVILEILKIPELKINIRLLGNVSVNFRSKVLPITNMPPITKLIKCPSWKSLLIIVGIIIIIIIRIIIISTKVNPLTEQKSYPKGRCLHENESITLSSCTRDSTLRIKTISQLDNQFNNSANIIEHLGTMGDLKTYTRIPAFKKFYSIVGDIEEHQEQRTTWAQWHNGISTTYEV